MSSSRRGTVKFWKSDKGWGFLSDGETDYFVHHSVIQGEGRKDLAKGQAVTFETAPGEKGPRAVNVVPQ